MRHFDDIASKFETALNQACDELMEKGFVKAEDRAGICRLAVHLRCYSRSGEDPGKVYLYFRHRQQLVGIYLGALKNRNGALEWQGTFSSHPPRPAVPAQKP